MATAPKYKPEIPPLELENDSSRGQALSLAGDGANDSQRHILKRPIVATTRKNIITMMQQVMEENGARGGLIQVTTAKEAKDALALHPQSLLFVDWQLGTDISVQILSAGRAGESLNLRPILLLITNVTAESAATAMEYAVSKVIAGQLTAPALLEQIENVKKSQENDVKIDSQLRKVAEARRAGETNAATQMISALYELYANDLRVAVEYASFLIDTDQWKEAESILQPLSTREPPYLRALSAYSRCLLKRGLGGEAESTLKKAKLINPYDVDRLIELGDVLLMNGKTREAQENFSEALQVDRGNKDARIGKATCNLLQDEINSALQLMHEVASPRELASVFNTAGIMAARDKKFQHAVKLYETATKLVDKNPWLVARLAYNEGLAFNKWDKPEEARKQFERAAKADPEFKKALRNAFSGMSGSQEDSIEVAEETIAVGTQDRRDSISSNKALSSEPKSMMDDIGDFGFDIEDKSSYED